jgi:hypothetical protein
MTPTRYLLARAAQAFGYVRKSQRMGDAAREMHLLREAEAYLGISIWENCKDIENLSVEYWNLRKLKKEHDELLEKIQAAESELDAAHQERAQALQITPESNQELLDQRAEKLKQLETLAANATRSSPKDEMSGASMSASRRNLRFSIRSPPTRMNTRMKSKL